MRYVATVSLLVVSSVIPTRYESYFELWYAFRMFLPTARRVSTSIRSENIVFNIAGRHSHLPPAPMNQESQTA
jgi:hypothetical protein